MKRLILWTYLISFAIALPTQAAEDMFAYDEEKVEQSLQELSDLDAYVEAHEGTRLTTILSQRELKSRFKVNYYAASDALQYDSFNDWINEMDWGSFAWGFCCGPCGVGIVLLSDSTNDQVRSSLLGLVTGIFVWGVSYGFWFLII